VGEASSGSFHRRALPRRSSATAPRTHAPAALPQLRVSLQQRALRAVEREPPHPLRDLVVVKPLLQRPRGPGKGGLAAEEEIPGRRRRARPPVRQAPWRCHRGVEAGWGGMGALVGPMWELGLRWIGSLLLGGEGRP